MPTPYINANVPGTMGQLQQIFGGADPQGAQSNLAMTDSRLADWASRTGQAQGIGNDPARYFAQQQGAQQMANYQQQSEQAQLQGYAPGTTPQFIHQQQFQQQLDTANQQRNIASLQNQQQVRLTANPLITSGSQLSPLQQQEANRMGVSPVAYNQMQRLGPNKNIIPVDPNNTNPITDPNDIFNHPNFQTALQQKPQQAAQVFQSLTGQDLGGYMQGKAAAESERQKYSETELQKAVSEGRIKHDPKTNTWMERKLVPDITKPGAFILGDYGPISDTTASMLKVGASRAFPDVARLDELTQKKAAFDAQQTALNAQSGRGLQPADMSGMTPSSSTLGNFLAPTLQDVSNPTQIGATQAALPNAGGITPSHVRALLANDPRFHKLMRENPQAARQMIVNMQMSKGVQPTPQPDMSGYGLGEGTNTGY